MNKWIGKGRLVKDPELNYSAGTGTAVCRLTLAVPRPFKKEETDFINCIAFSKRAETIAQYLTKGRELLIEGHIQVSKYQDKEGNNRYSTDVVIDSFEFIGNGLTKENTDKKEGLIEESTDFSWEDESPF